jgi:ketosteroid isomerase-like protein
VATTNAANEAINTAAIEAELTRIEKDFPRVLKEKDAQALDRVEADDIVIIYPDGEVGSKSEDINDIKAGALSADSWEVSDVKVNVLDKDAAFVTGRSIVTGGRSKTPDGKAIDISGQYRFIDTFARRNGEWKLVASISTPVKRPPAAAPASPSPKSSPQAAVSPIGKPKASPAGTNANTNPTP